MIFLVLYQDETLYEDIRLEVTRKELENAQKETLYEDLCLEVACKELENAQKVQQLEEIKQQTEEAQRAQESIARQYRRETLRARRDLINRWANKGVYIILSFNSGSYSLFLL
jgi:hypothetical protein